jgi:type II secretory pathway pseudopilin PulG
MNRKGFTLIEVALGIIVISLVAFGVIAIVTLIRSAQSKEVINQIQQMKTSMRTFRLQYNSVPGDLKSAYRFFGEKCGEDSDDPHVGCNGDGNNCVDSDERCSLSRAYKGELRKAFVHLNLSGSIPKYSYDIDSSDDHCEVGVTSPQSDIDGGFLIYSLKPKDLYINFFSVEDFSHNGTECEYKELSGSLNPRIAMEVDKKVDDGNGKKGTVQSITDYVSQKHDEECIDDKGEYKTDNGDRVCGIRSDL